MGAGPGPAVAGWARLLGATSLSPVSDLLTLSGLALPVGRCQAVADEEPLLQVSLLPFVLRDRMTPGLEP